MFPYRVIESSLLTLSRAKDRVNCMISKANDERLLTGHPSYPSLLTATRDVSRKRERVSVCPCAQPRQGARHHHSVPRYRSLYASPVSGGSSPARSVSLQRRFSYLASIEPAEPSLMMVCHLATSSSDAEWRTPAIVA